MIRPDYRNELYHYGIPRRSGRYPYGSGDRPFQGEPGDKRPKGFIQRHKAKKVSKAFEKMKEDEAKKQKIQEEYKKNRETILEKGTASDVLKLHKISPVSNAELEKAIDRLRLEKSIKEYEQKEKDAGFNKIDDLMKKMEKINNWSNTGIKLWDNFASIYNATDAGKSSPLNYVNKGKSGGENKDAKK